MNLKRLMELKGELELNRILRIIHLIILSRFVVSLFVYTIYYCPSHILILMEAMHY